MRFGELKILIILQERKNVTVKFLSEIIECSKKTVYRYIRKLNDAGFMIEYNDGFVILTDSRPIMPLFSKKEAEYLKKLIINRMPASFTPEEIELLLEKIEKFTKDN